MTVVRVLHVGPDINGRGGMAAVLRNLFASPLGDHHRLSFVRTYSSPNPLVRMLVFAVAVVRLARWCRGPGERVVHVHSATRGSWYRKTICVALVKALRRPVVLHLHAGPGDIRAFDHRIGAVRRRLFAASFARADRIFAVSASSAAELERIFGIDGVAVVPHAAPPVPKEKTSMGTSETGVDVLYLGGFADRAKGGDVLVEALPELLDRCPNLTVTLAGPGDPPSAARALLSSPAVRWEGYLDDAAKDAALRRAELFVMPSRSEGLPVALLEAMAYGRAIVATRVGGIPEVVTDQVTGVLVDAEDAASLLRALHALAGDPGRRRELGAAARARAEQLNGVEIVERLDRAYRELAA
jgi:glycosyltransferase involved in cell wall biosynthesis